MAKYKNVVIKMKDDELKRHLDKTNSPEFKEDIQNELKARKETTSEAPKAAPEMTSDETDTNAKVEGKTPQKSTRGRRKTSTTKKEDDE